MKILNCQNLSKSFRGKLVLKNLNLSLEEGKITALLGPNGAGKTTLIRLILGLLTADYGDIELFGQKLTPVNRSDLLSDIGVQNDGNLYGNLTVLENLKLWGRIYGMSSEKLKERLPEVVESFDLQDYVQVPIKRLSKGNRQKAALARAVIHQPKLLILDEPTTGLDPQMTEQFLTYLKRLISEQKMTVFMCTHHLFGLEDIVDEVAILSKQKILVSGNLSQLFDAYYPHRKLILEVLPLDKAKSVLTKWGHVSETGNRLVLKVEEGTYLPQMVSDLVEQGCQLYQLSELKPTLTQFYLEIIGGQNDDLD